jgi:hypothetical protein
LSHREPTFGPDAVIVPQINPPVTKFSTKIARTIEVVIFMYAMGFVAGKLGDLMFPTLHPKSLSLGVLFGGLGLILAFLGHKILGELEIKLKLHLHLSDRIAPFFGHKLDSTFRSLRG